MTDAPKLKPCPFCGGEVTLRKMIPRYDDAFVYCDECNIEGRRCDTDEQAITAWNTRADLIDMAVLARVERYIEHKGTCDSKGGHRDCNCGSGEALADLRAMMEKLK